MKANILILVIIAASAYFVTSHFAQKDTPSITQVPNESAIAKEINDADTMPQFTITDIKGKTHNTKDFKGKIIILNFWASWCAPCIKEFPNLIKAAENYPDDLIFLALSSDLDEKAINNFITKMEAQQSLSFNAKNIIIALDENQAVTAKKFQTFKLPETYIIDREQRIQNKLIGADWNYETLTKIIDNIR